MTFMVSPIYFGTTICNTAIVKPPNAFAKLDL